MEMEGAVFLRGLSYSARFLVVIALAEKLNNKQTKRTTQVSDHLVLPLEAIN